MMEARSCLLAGKRMDRVADVLEPTDRSRPCYQLPPMLLGRELDLCPRWPRSAAVHVIRGRHCLSADLMVALVLKSGLAEHFQLVDLQRHNLRLRAQTQGRS